MKRWPLKQAYFWETAPFFRVLLPFAAGIYCYDRAWLRGLPGSYLAGLTGLALVLYSILAYGRRQGSGKMYTSFLLLYVTLFSCGVAVAYLDDVRNDPAWFGRQLSSDNRYLVRVNEAPAEKDHSWKVPVTMISSLTAGHITPATGSALLYVYKNEQYKMLHKGDSLLIPGNWQLIKNGGNPFEFDYVAYCRRSGIFYRQFCPPDELKIYAANDSTAASFTDKAYNWCMRQLDRYIPEPKARGLIQAMILGNEANLDDHIRQSYADTGIIHIIAISGGNVAIFFIVICCLLWWLRHRKYLWVKYAIALPLVWVYVLMAGAAPSAVRAAVMFSLLAGTILFNKSSNSLNQLLTTAFLLLCAQPMWLFSVGFQLSFVAVLSLILFYTPVYKWLSPANKFLRLLWGTVAASIAAELLVAPLVIYYFHTFPLLFIVANAAAYIFMSIVLVLGIAVIALSFIPAVAGGIGMIIVAIVTVFDDMVTSLQNFSPESFHFLLLSGTELVLEYILLAGILTWLLRQHKAALVTGLISACLLAASCCVDRWHTIHQQRLVVYNTAKASYVEVIKGDTYTLLNTDPYAEMKNERTAKPAHTGWQAYVKDTGSVPELFELAGKKVLLLNKEVKVDARFPVDILVINYTGYVDLAALQRTFSPATIVLGGNYAERRQQQLLADGKAAGSNVHAVSVNGAFVLQ